MTTKNQLELGEIKYLHGFKSSKVKVIENIDGNFVLCRILTAPKGGKYEDYKGEAVYINRRSLYPRGER